MKRLNLRRSDRSILVNAALRQLFLRQEFVTYLDVKTLLDEDISNQKIADCIDHFADYLLYSDYIQSDGKKVKVYGCLRNADGSPKENIYGYP